MSDSDYFEFGVAHDRRYTLEHLWLQLIDEKDGTVKIGMSAVSYTHLRAHET